jgi:hypothetical protein
MPKHKWPRSVRGAVRRGWHLVSIPNQKDISYLGLQVYCTSFVNGHWISSFDPLGRDNKFAFEQESDAAWFTMKFT